MKIETKCVMSIAAVFMLVAAGVGTACFFGKCKSTSQQIAVKSAEENEKMAIQLIQIVREETTVVLRAWLVAHTPQVVEQVLPYVDNTRDKGGRARLAILDGIYSLGSEGLPEHLVRTWAEALRKTSNLLLNPGPVRVDYVAKSYLMEGRRDQAATAYRMIPDHPTAANFFKENPDLRGPASKN